MSRKGWLVTFSGMGLNLALGTLYAWSVFGKQFTEAIDKGGFGWSKTTAAMPYSIAIGFFALMMIPAGRLQDKLGPGIIATIGAVLMAAGMIVTSLATPASVLPAIIGFGILAGTGIGFGYASATPAAVKWFPPEKKGLIAGIVVAGFGLASVYVAPLSRFLLGSYGVKSSFLILGIAFGIVTLVITRFIKNPPAPVASVKPGSGQARTVPASGSDYTWVEMVKTPTFYLLWIEFTCGALAGLMIIGHLAKIVAVQSNNTLQIGFIFVALLAVFNAGGRVLAGALSDKIGRIRTILIVSVGQAIMMFLFSGASTITGFVIGSAIIGICYGSCLSLFPSACGDYWGMKNLGMNYGILFTAYGIGGIFGPILAGRIADSTGSYSMAYTIAAALMILAAVLTFFTKAPARRTVQEVVQAAPAPELQVAD
jgi:OFA family oxalate/formate antiporter-like MFS transporter